MTAARWKWISQIYHSALEREPPERATYVAGVCGEDEQLRRDVDSLLIHAEEARSLLEKPAVEIAAEQQLLPSATREQLAGRTLGRYQIVAPLGEGGFGEVYRARDTRLKREVALKVLRRTGLEDPKRKRRFEQEARAASALHHPNIVTVYDIDFAEGLDFIAMEYVPGKTLQQVVGRNGLDLNDALSLAIQIADALAAAHTAGIVHRDLKPGNVMLTDDGQVKLLDFGLAKLSDRQGEDTATMYAQTEEGAIMGTVAYMSPEQAAGKKVDARTDIFSFGAVLYEMITGRRAFERDSKAAAIAAILHDELLPASSLRAEMPPALDKLIARCVRKDPARRMQHMGDVRLGLEDLKEELATPHDHLAAQVAKTRRSWIAWAAAGFMVVTMGLREVTRPRVVPQNPLANAKFTRVTNFEGTEHSAAISGDGKWIAFRSDRDGPLDAWLTQVGTGRFTNLTQGRDTGTRYPTPSLGFSPDGSELWLFGSPAYRIRLMPLLGGMPRPFLRDGAISVAWSPDGTRIAYHTADEGDPMFIADRTGASPRRIFTAAHGWHNHFPTWSRDGRWIYFVGGFSTGSRMDVWRVSVAGGAPERLTQHDSDIAYPTPIDNGTVLYVGRDSSGSGPWLWAVDVERKLSRRLSFGLEQYTSIAASSDGHRLVATIANPSASLWSVPIMGGMATQGDVKPFPVPNANAHAPRFGGSSFFYLSARGTGCALWRYEGDQAVEISKGLDGSLLEPPAVSADGSRLAVVLRRGGTPRLHLISPDGAEIQPIAENLEVSGTACWSPDKKWIATGGTDAQGAGLFKIPAEGGAPIRLAPGPALHPVWSPNGNLIVYEGPEVGGSLPLLAVTPDGAPVKLPAIDVNVLGERVRFLPDGKSLVYTQGNVAGQNFWILHLGTKKTRQVTTLRDGNLIRTFDVMPDGRSIVFDQLRDDSDVVLIDLGLKQP